MKLFSGKKLTASECIYMLPCAHHVVKNDSEIITNRFHMLRCIMQPQSDVVSDVMSLASLSTIKSEVLY